MGLVALLAAEAAGLTIRFDSATATGPLPELLLSLPAIGFRLFVGVATVALILSRQPSAGRGEPRDAGTLDRPSWGPVILVHAGALGLFTWLTHVVLEGPSRSLVPALLWASAWSGAGLLTLASWAAIGVPPTRWGPLLRRGRALLPVGGALGLGIWGVGQMFQGLWASLAWATLRGVELLLHVLSTSPVCDPEAYLVGTPTFQVRIASSCSGYEGMGLVLCLVSAYLWVARDRLRFPRALLLLPVGVGLIWLANVVRIAALIALGSAGLGGVALNGFHSQAGWLAFNAIGLGLVLVAGRWSFLRAGPDLEARDEPNPTSPYLVPFLVLIGAAMVSDALPGGSAGLYPFQVASAAGALWLYRRRYGELRPTFSLGAVAIGCSAFALWMALEPLAPSRGSPQGGPMVGPRGLGPLSASSWLAARVIGSVLVVPLVEELAFRGYLTRRLIAAEYWSLPTGAFTWASFLVSSALFGVLHGRWLAGTLTGMLFGLALYRRQKLFDAVIAHATTNALIAAYVLATGDWALWQ
ncbi:exosortase E/protease, VPEID-CTERM system [Tautonia plasticadhaerens]|uniref:Transmembrane exosortase (Exosortase_EpsH) n=1 Tax=Tautonia plasticadhaerens TaxID=2527974 RepID=A0A518HC25_9BACT|nr:exosortase E/protease, VPEID-CTERM system [Tautonia plasticadhaerens]QDV38412.1 Transmembrane exosortase (Exosortase_EpsH) [Tautonia plasticadhaerens]